MASVYVKAAVITTIIFFLGLGIGWFLDLGRAQAVRSELEELKIQADEARVGMVFFQTFKQDPRFCEVFAAQTSAQLQRVGALGTQLEKLREANKLDPSYYPIKRQYVLFNTELWMHAINLKRLCNSSVTTILYFYPEGACAECGRQASELLQLKRACPNDVWIFALPVDLNITVVDMIAKKQGIARVPSLVVNEETLAGLQSANALGARFPPLAKCV